MLGLLCPVCQLAQQRCSALAHYEMTDFLLAGAERDEIEDDIECEALTEDQMLACGCYSCRSYQLRLAADRVYNRRYNDEMERVKAAVSKPFYSGWECP